jgi:hypothetical protein
MMAVEEAETLGRRHFALGFTADNYDTGDSLGLDVFDVRLAWRFGVTERLDVYGRGEISRAVSVPGMEPIPPPPLDIVVPRGGTIPRAPYRAIYWPMPYLGDEPANLLQMIPGEYAFGLKVRLTSQRGLRPATSAGAAISIPSTSLAHDLAKGSGSGSLDAGIHGAATWRANRLTVSANAGYTANGSVRRGDRLVMVTGSEESPIIRPDIASDGAGVRVRISRHASFCGELSGWLPVRYRTPVFQDIGNADALAGFEFAFRALRITAAVRHHFQPLPNGVLLDSGPLGGSLDLSGANPAERDAYLRAIGIDPPNQRNGARTIVVSPPDNVPVPPGATAIPREYRSNTKGNNGIVIALAVAI